MNTRILTATCLTATLALTACDGGTTAVIGPTAPVTNEGLWSGVFDISTDATANTRTFNALVTPDGTLWMTYSRVSDPTLAGVIQGAGTADTAARTYTAPAVTEQNASLTLTGALSGLYVSQSKFSGNITTNVGGLRTLSFNPSFAVNYDLTYAQAPGLAPGPTTVNGTGIVAGSEVPVTLVLDPQAGNPSQVLVGQSGPSTGLCYFSSPVTGASAGNYFNLSVTFIPGAGCDSQGLSGTRQGVLFRTPTGKFVLVTGNAVFGFQET
ncbi:MAG TPA: hypothetical protein VFM34_04970 [Moraxellaceae bacterium]|nr:hypothetical protein [Moraxellaceae bacterium]